ncbi:transaldolase family protein [Luethyella okanaganae]|uniref:Transaldolase family protein n=1 Tax=Luethyella okanaganae TaxID=69372 RepID=A0ABW1VDG4_9MICO
MKLYADSADTAQVVPMLRDGLIRGVTTNPSIIARDGLTRNDLPRLYDEFGAAGADEIFMQATGGSRAELLADASRIADFGHRIVVKVPATPDGFRVARELQQRDVRVLLTAVYSLAQATFAAALGVDYVAPYFGRLVDSGEDGLSKVSNMTQVLSSTRTRVLVASVRSPNAAATLALNGVSHITADVPVLLAMMLDPATEQSAAEFERVAGESSHRSAGTEH